VPNEVRGAATARLASAFPSAPVPKTSPVGRACRVRQRYSPERHVYAPLTVLVGKPTTQGYGTGQWIVRSGSDNRLHPDRMAVAGDSVGGCMTAALALMASQRSEVRFVPVDVLPGHRRSHGHRLVRAVRRELLPRFYVLTRENSESVHGSRFDWRLAILLRYGRRANSAPDVPVTRSTASESRD
jgi:alpha/beta hydrolase fold